jgi:hypothetical protein
MATYSNLFVDQGSDFSFSLNLESTIGPFDLNNYTARGKIKRNYASLSSVDFVISIDVNENTLIVELDAVQTQAMKPTRYVYDIELVSSDSPASIIRVLEGQLEVTPSVSSV